MIFMVMVLLFMSVRFCVGVRNVLLLWIVLCMFWVNIRLMVVFIDVFVGLRIV